MPFQVAHVVVVATNEILTRRLVGICHAFIFCFTFKQNKKKSKCPRTGTIVDGGMENDAYGLFSVKYDAKNVTESRLGSRLIPTTMEVVDCTSKR